MEIITCPNCKVRVIPKTDGKCPNCQSIILKKKKNASRLRPEGTGDKISQRAEKDTRSYQEINWDLVDWKKVYTENRPRVWNKWMVIAVILVSFSLYSLISKRPLTISLGGLIQITNQYVPIILLLTGIAVTLYKINEMLAGKRLVVHGKIIEKSISKKDMKYFFFMSVKNEFNLNAKGELESFDTLEKLPQNFIVDFSVYKLYNKNDTVTFLFLSDGNFICDLRDYV